MIGRGRADRRAALQRRIGQARGQLRQGGRQGLAVALVVLLAQVQAGVAAVVGGAEQDPGAGRGDIAAPGRGGGGLAAARPTRLTADGVDRQAFQKAADIGAYRQD